MSHKLKEEISATEFILENFNILYFYIHMNHTWDISSNFQCFSVFGESG